MKVVKKGREIGIIVRLKLLSCEEKKKLMSLLEEVNKREQGFN